MENKEKLQSIKDEVKGYITLSDWQMGEVADNWVEEKIGGKYD